MRTEAVAAAIDAQNVGRDGIGVRRAGAGAGARPASGADPYVVLVQLARTQCASILIQEPTKSGTVLRVVAMSEMRTSSTPRPSTAQAMASRWSS